MNIVSRGGSLLFGWMEVTGNENPFYEYYDEVLEICHEYDVTISLGDSCRPGCLFDSNDAAETAEIIEIGKLTKRAWDAGVQVMIEGPGHMAINEIAANVALQKRLCHGAPYYVLGPLVTTSAWATTTSQRPSAERSAQAPGRTSSATSRRRSTCACPTPTMCARGSSLRRSPRMPPTSRRACRTRATLTIAWVMHDAALIGMRCGLALDADTARAATKHRPPRPRDLHHVRQDVRGPHPVNKVFEGTTIDLGTE